MYVLNIIVVKLVVVLLLGVVFFSSMILICFKMYNKYIKNKNKRFFGC